MESRTNLEHVAAIRRGGQSAFGELRKIWFITRSNFSCCQTCATYELAEMAARRRRNRACYWHVQDEQHFKRTGVLFMRFCYLPPPGINGNSSVIEAQIGEQVVVALRNAGLRLEWPGNPNVTIKIVGVANGSEQPDGKEVANGPNATL